MESIEIEKLDKMFKEGKISSDEYWELYNNLPKPPDGNSKKGFLNIPTSQPWQIWVCAIFLFVVAVYDLFWPPHHLGSLFAAVLSVGLGIGLLKRNKIAYIITMVIGIVTILYCVDKWNIIAILINSTYCIILGSAWKHYFKSSE